MGFGKEKVFVTFSMSITIKRAGLPIDFVSWQEFMDGIAEDDVLGSVHTAMEDLPMFQPDEEVELQFWMEDHSDEPVDIEINEDDGRPAPRQAMFRRATTGGRPVLHRATETKPMRAMTARVGNDLPEHSRAIPGVVSIRSFLR